MTADDLPESTNWHCLSHSQGARWLEYQIAPERRGQHNVAFSFQALQGFDPLRLELALTTLLKAHAALRVEVRDWGGAPMQRPVQIARALIEVVDAAQLSEQELLVRVRLDAQRPFDLTQPPLARAAIYRASGRDVLLLVLDHLAADGLSFWRVVERLGELLGLSQDDLTKAGEVSEDLSFFDHVRWQREWMTTPAAQEQLLFWQRENSDAVPALPIQRCGRLLSSPEQEWPIRKFFVRTDVDLAATKIGVSAFSFLMGCLQVALFRLTGEPRLTIGTMAHGRPKGRLSCVGDFANPILVAGRLDGSQSLSRSFLAAQRQLRRCMARQAIPFAAVLEQHRRRTGTANAAPHAMLVFQNSRDGDSVRELLGGGDRSVTWGVTQVSGYPVYQAGDLGSAGLLLDAAQISDRYLVDFRFAKDLYDSRTVNLLADTFERVLLAAVLDSSTPIRAVDILTSADRAFASRAATPVLIPASEGTLSLSFERVAAENAQRPAIWWRKASMTYGELDQLSGLLARLLGSRGVKPGNRVAIVSSRSFAAVVAQLAVLRASCTYVPIDAESPPERVAFILEDSSPAVVIVEDGCHIERGLDLPIVRLSSDGTTLEASNPIALTTHSSTQDPAYVIYTSGSTGRPKGVVIEHKSVLALLSVADEKFAFGATDVWTLFHSTAFDFSVWEIWGCLLSGGSLVVVDGSTSRNPEELYALLCDEGVTVLNQTPGAFQGLIEAQARSQREHCLRCVVFGGEALDYQSLRGWISGNCLDRTRLVNMYGITETTVHTTFHEITLADVEEGHASVIGIPLPHLGICVLDPDQSMLPMGATGELYVTGLGVARGYLGRPELTAERFTDLNVDGRGQERWYRSGDLGRWRADGVLEYLGRNDAQVKIRGHRVELGEIESAVRRQADVAQCVVVALEDPSGNKQLVAYVVLADAALSQSSAAQRLRVALGESLPAYMSPSAVVCLHALPLTINGKIDRQRLPKPDRGDFGVDSFTAPTGPTERNLALIWEEVLEVATVGRDDDFFALGGHSLLATKVTTRIRSTFGIEFPVRELFASRQLRTLARRIDSLRTDGTSLDPAWVPVAHAGQIRASFAQERVWFLCQMEPNSVAYNIQVALRLRGNVDVERVQHALDGIVQRHQALRTAFELIDGAVYQRVSPSQRASFELVDFTDSRDTDGTSTEQSFDDLVADEARSTFDLRLGPLLRTKFVRLAESEHVLVLVVHHIVADGWSMNVLLEEFCALYPASIPSRQALADLSIQYADFAVRQRESLVRGGRTAQEIGYWKEQLQGASAVLELPTDRPRPAVQTHRGAALQFELSGELLEGARKLGRARGATLFMVLGAAFNVLLHRYSGQQDISVGSPVAGRDRTELEGLIGFFVNTLVLRSRIDAQGSFEQLLEQFKETALQAFAHQELPFEQLVEELKPTRSLSYSPLFQVMFVLQNMPQDRRQLEGLSFEVLPTPTSTAKFDLTLSMWEERGRLKGSFEYNTDLFDEQTIQRMAQHYEVLLQGICEDPGAKVGQLPLLTAQERRRILVEWNQTQAEYPQGQCVHELFEQQVQRTPQAVAVVFEGQELSYEQLNAQANRLAHRLRSEGVGPDTLVAICVERSLEMVVGLLGILKAGGAYVPLDPSYPQERLSFMLQDAAPKVVLTQHRLQGVVQAAAGTSVIELDGVDGARTAAFSDLNLPVEHTGVRPEHLAYVIYTSGSTGMPKGAGVSNRGLINLVHWYTKAFNFDRESRVLLISAYGFDLTQKNFFAPLIAGGRLCLPLPGYDPPYLVNCIANLAITSINCTPSMFYPIIEGAAPGRLALLKHIFLGGEPIEVNRLNAWLCRMSGQRPTIHNTYGPTECTDVVAFESWRFGDETAIPLGRPVPNCQLFVLDANLAPVPAGVSGELCIAGTCVGRGYRNRDDLTAEKFVANPFVNEWPNSPRMYRTGDVARYRSDGRIDYLGRRDQQVKLRGLRVELGEVESALRELPGIADAAAIVRRPTSDAEPVLAVYVIEAVAAGEQGARSTGSERAIRFALGNRLPAYMVPSRVVLLKALPLSPNGKVDRAKLASLPLPEEARSEAYVPPQTKTEAALAAIWQEILGIRQVGPHDNFFDLGGHSLALVRLHHRIEAEFHVSIPIASLFQHRSLHDLAEALASQTTPVAEATPIGQRGQARRDRLSQAAKRRRD